MNCLPVEQATPMKSTVTVSPGFASAPVPTVMSVIFSSVGGCWPTGMDTAGLAIVPGGSVEPAASVPGGVVATGMLLGSTQGLPSATGTGIVPLGWVTPGEQAMTPVIRPAEAALSSTKERRRIGCRTLSLPPRELRTGKPSLRRADVTFTPALASDPAADGGTPIGACHPDGDEPG